ncbi:uncharacterized protein [Miscanthus floridulus]|uniref:uncharacterized protein isoform X2 n=1 Tax=Miscanthus floridulus TaxID=154761 RepID=UPI003459C72B
MRQVSYGIWTRLHRENICSLVLYTENDTFADPAQLASISLSFLLYFRFFHARLRKYAGIFSSDSKWANESNQDFLCMGDEEQSEQFVLELFQWMLPKYVCFKGDNGKYLSAQSLHNKPFLVFESEDINDPTVRHTTTASRDGTMRIKSDHFGRFWRNSGSSGTGSWIHADSTDDTSNNDDPNTLFQAFYTGGAIGVLNQGSNQYCKRLTTKNVEHGLSATGTRFEAWSRLQFEEPVVSREIDHVHFKDVQAVIVGDDRYTVLATASVTNTTSSTMPAVKLALDYTLEETWGWYSTVTLKSPVRTSITSPFVYVQYGFLAMSPRFFHGLISWGADHKKHSKVSEEYVVDVPPMTKVTVTCQGVAASFEVPFSYRQTDKLIDGEVVTLQYDDGNFSGRNVHSIYYVTREEKIGQ